MPSLLSPSLTADDLVALIVESADLPEPSFAALLEEIHKHRYSGAVVLHFQHGAPKALELPRPSVTLKIASGT